MRGKQTPPPQSLLRDFKLSLDDRYLKIKFIAEYYAEWENVRARVVRPDVECIDGVIHVIDTVLVQRREISVSGGSYRSVDALLIFLVAAAALLGRRP